MRSVSDQVAAVLAAARPMAPLDVVLADASGCVLAEDLVADRDLPAFAVAGRDGYAVRSADAPGWDVRLPVVDDSRPTSARTHLVPGSALLVAAGAPLPEGADAVVALEDTDRGRANVTLRGGVRPGEGVRAAGVDARLGRVLLLEGTRLGPRHVALAAALGRGRLWVRPMPRVVVVTVGDELVDAGRRLQDGRVHDAVGHALVAAAREAGGAAVRVGPVPDDPAVLREVLADQMVRADLLVLAGGLGGGLWDTVADVLAPFGAVRVDQVAMSPGGRMGLGRVSAVDGGPGRGAAPDGGGAGDGDGPDGDGPDDGGSDDALAGVSGVLVAALPGQPVAALVSFEVLVRPAIRAMAGYAELFRPTVRAALTVPVVSTPGLTQLVPASVLGSPGEGYTVTALDDPGQVSLAALARANALLVLAEDQGMAYAGDVVPCLVLEG